MLGFIVASGPVGRQCEAQRVASQPFRAGYDVALVSAARTPMQQTGDGGGNGLSIVVAVGAAASALAALRAAFAAKELEKKRVDREYDELKVRMFLPHDADDPLVRPSLSMYKRRTTTCRPTNKRR